MAEEIDPMTLLWRYDPMTLLWRYDPLTLRDAACFIISLRSGSPVQEDLLEALLYLANRKHLEKYWSPFLYEEFFATETGIGIKAWREFLEGEGPLCQSLSVKDGMVSVADSHDGTYGNLSRAIKEDLKESVNTWKDEGTRYILESIQNLPERALTGPYHCSDIFVAMGKNPKDLL